MCPTRVLYSTINIRKRREMMMTISLIKRRRR
jgi:hypothetical protein